MVSNDVYLLSVCARDTVLQQMPIRATAGCPTKIMEICVVAKCHDYRDEKLHGPNGNFNENEKRSSFISNKEGVQ